VGRADARSADIDRCAGVIRAFQVSLYKVEPLKAVAACNLLAKDDCRAALRDETEQVRPEVALVAETVSLACGAEGLTWAASCPNRSIVGPSGLSQRVRPDADPREEMALSVSA
jgi:hypothetical protein